MNDPTRSSEWFAPIRGVKDILPNETILRHYLEEMGRLVFGLYGYQEVRTPLFERTDLFTRAVGETTDIVEKEMYTFPDRNGESMTLRPEGTASVVRVFIHNALHRQLPWRVFYSGPMFRYERPQKGRYRQFHQIGCELFGPVGPLADAEMMAMAWRYLERIGLANTLTLEINSLGCPECRPAYSSQLIAFLSEQQESLCPNCRQRLQRNPLRVLDCKHPQCQEIAKISPQMMHHLCVACADHFKGLLVHLEQLGLPHRLNPLMVRGLDYYSRTAFEITTDALGTQNGVVAGGRYDGLVAQMGGVSTPAIGFAMGVERLVLLLEQQKNSPSAPQIPVYLVAVGGSEAASFALRVAESLRQEDVVTDMNLLGGSMKSQMKKAGHSQARFTVIIGDDETRTETICLKEMATGYQLTMPWRELPAYLVARTPSLHHKRS
ncbi:MAG: histidine--tRNA ligase [Magnetococcus sp. DMHC-6]